MMKPDEIPVIEVAKLNSINTTAVYLPIKCINKYPRKRVDKPYNFVLESKQMVQNISQSKEKVILFGIMR